MDSLVIGIDGADWSVIDPLVSDGQLPNLAQLISNGVKGELESITPPVSPPAWNTIQTGSNPGKHGIYDFSHINELYSLNSVNSTDRQATPFWRILNDYGVQTGLFKVPFTYPPDKVDGFMVTGFPTPETVHDFVHPKAISDLVGAPEHLFEDSSFQASGDYLEYKRNLIEVAHTQTEVLLNLVESHDPEFLMTVYDGADRIQHFFWKYVDENHPRHESNPKLSSAFREYYKEVDAGIGRLLQSCPDTLNVVILSDHGFGRLAHDIYIEEWLEREGFISRMDQNVIAQTKVKSLSGLLKLAWDAVGYLKLQEPIRSILPDHWYARGEELRMERFRGIDWQNTSAFFTTLSGQAVQVNRKKRFIRGNVSDEDYAETLESLITSIESLRHPETNERLIERVVRSEEEFQGWALDRAPDLIVETAPEYTLRGGKSESLVKPSRQNENDRSGDHRRNGILVANGPAFRSDTLKDAGIEDIAPTILYLHDCPIPKTMDGRVLTNLFREEYRLNQDIKYTENYGQTSSSSWDWSRAEEAELQGRLSDMGYL